MMLPDDAIFFDDDTEPDFGTTISGLIALAKRCPELHTISVAIDSNAILSTDRRPIREAYALETLRVGKSPIWDPEQLAVSLSEVFPKLSEIDCDWSREEDLRYARGEEELQQLACEVEYRRKWLHVEELVKHFVRVRAQERTWIAQHRPTVAQE